MSRSRFTAMLAGAVALCARPARAADAVSVLHAGSFTTVFERRLAPAFARATGRRATGEGRGSVANARLIANGLKDPDVFVSSDVGVVRDLVATAPAVARWYAAFATTALVVAYSPKSAQVDAFAAAAAGRRPWYEVLATPGIRVARTDPAIDPLGYRTLIALRLAEPMLHRPDLSARLTGGEPDAHPVLDDETILVRLDTGELDAAFVYRIEAVSRSLPVIPLPPEIDLGDRRFAERYAAATVSVNGVERRGEPIEYGFTIPVHAPDADGALAFVTFMLSNDGRAILDAAGLTTHAPAFGGDLAAVPAALRA